MMLGNHEAMILGLTQTPNGRESVYLHQGARAELGQEAVWNLTIGTPFLFLDAGDRRILFLHGAPWDPLNGYYYPDTEFPHPIEPPADIVVMGHTHYPFARHSAGRLMCNPGSVGLPRDHGALISFAILDPGLPRFDLYRIPMDPHAVLDAYPGVHPSIREVLLKRRCDNPRGTLVPPEE